MSLLKAQYYDHPEGKDAFGKIVATNKYAALVGLAWSTVDVLMKTKPNGYLPTVARYAYNVGPMMGMASAFTLGTYMSTNVRGKDDKLNYVIGGFCAGGVYGAWMRSAAAGGVAGLAFSAAAFVKKLSIEEGWQFFPDAPDCASGISQHDFTLTTERPKNWSTGQ